MQFLNGKTMPRRTFLRGMGATLALPYLDAMTPAFSRFHGATDDRTRMIFIEQVHGAAGSNALGASKNLWAPAGVGQQLRAHRRERARAARSVAQVPDHRQQHRRAHGRSVRAAGDRRRPLPLERDVPHAVASEADAGFRPVRRHVDRPDHRAAHRPEHARCRRCSSASRTSTRPAAATTTTAARTRTRSAGRARASRCR